jgi:hypothetical protein
MFHSRLASEFELVSLLGYLLEFRLLFALESQLVFRLVSMFESH